MTLSLRARPRHALYAQIEIDVCQFIINNLDDIMMPQELSTGESEIFFNIRCR